jgi:hypothetical protein
MLPAKTLCSSISASIVRLVKKAQVKYVNSQLYHLWKSISIKLITCTIVSYVLTTNQFCSLNKSSSDGINTTSIKKQTI